MSESKQGTTDHPAETHSGTDWQNPANVNSADKTVTDPWVARLRGEPDVRDAALVELREILVRGLSKSMSTRYGGGLTADDVVQDALIKILDSLDQFAQRSRFTTWAMTVATRIGISEMRKKHYQDVSIESFKTSDAFTIDLSETQNESATVNEDRRWMIETLQGLIETDLSEKQRFAIRASLAGLPVEVIAEKSSSNRNSVYKLVHDARVKLRVGLEAAGIAAEDLATLFV